MLYCKVCGRQFRDDDEAGDARDQLDVHITDVHGEVYDAVLRDVFVGKPGDVSRAVEALETEGR